MLLGLVSIAAGFIVFFLWRKSGVRWKQAVAWIGLIGAVVWILGIAYMFMAYPSG